ncbi:MAG: hypothetical protein CEN90_534 [Parcubacteria group bacterium Licking1014_17]|nr:MAG: hypothetical protein CEN90_534 [Parcubacteria group bacterium Licking1014_17]
MAQDIKIWEVIEEKLHEVKKDKLNLEERLETWAENDISTISNDFLVIGRQIETDFDGVIDLLCLDYNGDLIIIELKRDKTPRDIVAQVLDYASWVEGLTNEKISNIAKNYFGTKRTLEDAFMEKFGTELPETLNEHHKMLIVGSEIDNSSERIIEYLSKTYGVSINIATFQYFKHGGKEFMARVFLIEPSEADYRTQSKSTSKRKPPLTVEELENIAIKNGVGDLYNKSVNEIKKYIEYIATTRSSIVFIGIAGKEKSRRSIISILPEYSNQNKGLFIEIRLPHFQQYFKTKAQDIKNYLPPCTTEKGYGWDDNYYGGYFKNGEQVEKFVSLLRKLSK